MSDGCHALAIGPHPDDVELGCGGTIASLTARGYDVRIVDLTRGELASNGTPETRAAEAAEAAKVLGVDVRDNLGLPDGGLDPYDEAAVSAVVDALRRHRPQLVLAPWRQARHPDHEAASELVRRAAYLAGLKRVTSASGAAPYRPPTLLWYPLRVTPAASFLVDISDHVGTKCTAIASYASQVVRDAGATATLVNAASGHAALRAREITWGAQIGVAAAEAFVTDQALPVADPVAFFADAAAPLLYPERR